MKQKVYIVNQHYYPELASTGQVFQEIAEHLAKEGYDVQVVAGVPFYHDNISTELDIKELNGVKIKRLWNTSFPKSSFVGKVCNLLSFQISLLGYMVFKIRKNSVVLVGTNPPMGIVCGAIGKLLRRYKFVGVIQDLYPDILISTDMSDGKGFTYKLLSKIMKASFAKCDDVVTISEDMKSHIEQTYNVADVKVITNMVVGDTHPIDNVELKKQAGFEDKLVVMYSGNFGIAHEYHTLLQAIKILKEEREIVFYIVGGGINYKELKEECEQAQLPNVVFKPYVEKEKLNESLNTGDIHITVFNNAFKNVLLPSKYYGILACAKPVILIADGENDISRDINKYNIGITVQKDRGEDLAKQLLELKDNQRTLPEISKRVKELYESKYAKSVVLDKYSKVVKDLCKN